MSQQGRPLLDQDEAANSRHQLISSRRVEGTPVYDRTAQRLGSIHSVMIDKKSGRAALAVLSLGGLLGIAESVTPVPWKALDYDVDLDAYVIDLTREQLQNAPTLRLDQADRPRPQDYEEVSGYYAERLDLRTPLRRMGNSAGLAVPKAILAELGSEIGDEFEIKAENGRIVAAPLTRRETWDDVAGARQPSLVEETQLAALAIELKGAADRMATRLDKAIAGLREANDPTRDEQYRARARAEISANPIVLAFASGPRR